MIDINNILIVNLLITTKSMQRSELRLANANVLAYVTGQWEYIVTNNEAT